MSTATDQILGLSWIREALGNTPLIQTANRLAKVLADGGIPHLIVGGLAVQQHGYVRTTVDVDMVVPNVADAIDYLSIRGFQEVPGNKMALKDRINRVDVDLLPGGGCVGPCLVKLPQPTVVSSKLQFIDIAGLVTQKLSSYYSNPKTRLTDLSDVVKLIQLSYLPRTLQVADEVKSKYEDVWDQYAI